MKLSQHRPFVFLCGLAAVALAVIGAGAHWFASQNEPLSSSPEAAKESSADKVVLSGYADLEGGIVSLYALQPGRVEKILVQENQHVAAGKELLALDDRLARWKLQEAEADLTAARTKIAQAKQAILVHQGKIALQKDSLDAADKRLSVARHKLKRGKELFDIKLMSAEEFKSAADQVAEAEAGARAERSKLDMLQKLDATLDLKLAEANLESKKTQRETAKYGLDERILRAPAEGLVLRINLGAGDVISPMPQEPAILFGVSQQRVIRFNVEQEFADRVKPGYPAEVHDFINPKLGTWKGKVVRLADVFMHTRSLLPQKFSLNMDETRTLEGLVVLNPGQPSLRLGQRVRVVIQPNVP
jgi:multidrug resistance efflux pump